MKVGKEILMSFRLSGRKFRVVAVPPPLQQNASELLHLSGG